MTNEGNELLFQNETGDWIDVTSSVSFGNTGRSSENTNVTIVDGGFKETYMEGENGGFSFSFTEKIEIAGKNKIGYRMLFEKFFNCQKSGCLSKPLQVQVYLGCCDKTKYYEIPYTEISWKPYKCVFEFSMIAKSICDTAISCLKDSYWWANDFRDWLEVNDRIVQFQYTNPVTNFVGKVPTIRIMDILNYNFERCEVLFQSSIFENELYSNLTIGHDVFQVLPSIYRDGLENRLPEKTTLDLLNDLGKLFNAKYEFTEKDGQCVCTFERRDFFNTPQKILDLNQFEVEADFNFQLVDDERLACKSLSMNYEKYGVFDYTIETRLQYQYLKNWSQNPDIIRRQKCEVTAPFHAPLFESASQMKFITQQEVSAEIPLIFAWSGIDQIGAETYSLPVANSNGLHYNYPLSFIEDSDYETLYRFYEIDDPNTLTCKFSIEDLLTIQPSKEAGLSFCELIDIIEKYGTKTAFRLSNDECGEFILTAKEYEINYDKSTLRIVPFFEDSTN